MANGHGGDRVPAHPAPASGPGSLSKRTDGQAIRLMTDQNYGERTAMDAQQHAAPMSQTPSVPAMPVRAGAPQYGGGAFNAPTARPGEPVTHGAGTGPGGGPEVLGAAPPGAKPTGQMTAMLAQMSATDTTGTLARLYEIAAQRGV